MNTSADNLMTTYAGDRIEAAVNPLTRRLCRYVTVPED